MLPETDALITLLSKTPASEDEFQKMAACPSRGPSARAMDFDLVKKLGRVIRAHGIAYGVGLISAKRLMDVVFWPFIEILEVSNQVHRQVCVFSWVVTRIFPCGLVNLYPIWANFEPILQVGLSAAKSAADPRRMEWTAL